MLSDFNRLRPILIWIAAGLVGLIGLVVLIAISAGIWLSTPSGRDFVLSKAGEAVPELTVEGADGSIFDLRAARITMQDADGVWLTVDGAHLVWNPWALFSRTLSVSELSAKAVTVARAPLPKPHDPNDQGGLPRLPVAVPLSRLAVERVVLGPDLLDGNPAVLSVAGQGRLPAPWCPA
ncbi:MAG: hypothetical protein JHC88_20925 [Niveispirillum sp.]|nr:hypothetical protein [Niveispirillum sp.]